jgi:hypothetical protein
MDNDEVRATLTEIASLLEAGDEEMYALLVWNALSGSAQDLENFLISNELWGGSGSIADRPFVDRSPQRKELEKLLIRLGRIQLRSGKTNIRTQSWVTACEKWHERGI